MRATDDALPFWLRMGFTRIDEVHADIDDRPVSGSIALVKPLT